MRNLLGVEISVAVIGIRRHIHHMGIALRLDGSMSSVPHVRLPLDALFWFQASFHNEDGSQTSGYRKVMVCLYNAFRYAISSSERIKLTVASM